jgi:hypothetical protein
MPKTNPYQTFPGKCFWRTAIADRNYRDIEEIYEKKFEISKEMRIVTAGSCFAQHVARQLKAVGFNYCDYEPAPPLLPATSRQTYGYGVYSARYANIYTARQLLQTFDRAFGLWSPQEDVWRENGRWYDPFRPAIEPDGFASGEEFAAARAAHFRAVRRVFTESDLFVFTFGLTEAWESTLDGAVFEVCPGTAAGTFDPDRHRFHNFTYSETMADMETFVAKLREVNPAVRILFTVSPVPLVATAAGAHVLVSTTYSKSVLRAVAGELAARYDFIDYFPSYELIASPPARGRFYGSNLRTVTPAGVKFVMRGFCEAHGISPVEPTSRAAIRVAADPEEDETPTDVVCEEMFLEESR